MKKNLIFLPLILACGLTSCNKTSVSEYPESDMVLNYSSYTVDLNEKVTLSVQNEKLNRKIVWSSNNKDVATVNQSGVVTGIKVGEATVTATYKNLEKTCRIVVTNSYSVAYIALDENNISLGIDGFEQVTASTIFAGSEVEGLTYTWSVENPLIVSVSNYNEIATISALKAGSTSVFVTTNYKGNELIGMIEVTVHEGVAYFDVKNVDLIDGEYSVSLKKNSIKTLDIDVYVDGIKVVDPYFITVSENDTIATVEGNVLIALQVGSTAIRVYYKNLGYVTINVIVRIL